MQLNTSLDEGLFLENGNTLTAIFVIIGVIITFVVSVVDGLVLFLIIDVVTVLMVNLNLLATLELP